MALTGTPPTPAQPLAGLRVLDCTAGVAGAFCTKLLADYGADVVLVERPDGSPLRRRGPLAPIDGGGHGALFAWLATNKTSIVPAAGAASWLREHAGLADVLVGDREFGLDPEFLDELRAANPQLIVVGITPFGRDGPYAGFASSRLVKAALAGWMQLVGQKGREPLVTRGDQLSECFPGAYAAVAVLACLLRRCRTGAGERIDLCETEALMYTNRYFETVFSYTGSVRERQGTATGSAYGIFKTLDGAVALGVAGHVGQWERLCEVTRQPGLLELERLGAFKDNPRAHELITDWFSRQTTAGAFLALQEDGKLPSGPVITGEDAPTNAQHVARGYIRTVDDPAVGPVRIPGPPALLHSDSWQLRSPAPRLGDGGAATIERWRAAPHAFMPDAPAPASAAEDSARGSQPRSTDDSSLPHLLAAAGEGLGVRARGGEISDSASHAPGGPFTLHSSPFTLPLAGVRVVECVDWWAGPQCGMVLADLGAEVIKVESPTRLEVWRTTSADANSPRPWETGPLYNAVNRNKRHIGVDLKQRRGLDAWQAVLRNADVLVENFTPGVVEGFGFDYEAFHRENPRLSFASISGFGQTGPWRAYRANAIVAEATGLVSAATGYGDGDRVAHGVGPGDTSAGTMTALGIVLALLERTRTGAGQRIDSSQMETLSAIMGESIVAASLLDEPWGPAGNDDDTCSPANAYRCSGDDEWLAASVANEAQWHALCTVIGRADWLADAGLSTPDGRRARSHEIDEGITAWTRRGEKLELMQQLQAAGVPAAAVLSPVESLSNEHWEARGFYRYLERPYCGTHPYYAPFVRLHSSPLEIRTMAPLFGADTTDVLRSIAGLSETEVASLLEARVCSTEFLGVPHLDPTRH